MANDPKTDAHTPKDGCLHCTLVAAGMQNPVAMIHANNVRSMDQRLGKAVNELHEAIGEIQTATKDTIHGRLYALQGFLLAVVRSSVLMIEVLDGAVDSLEAATGKGPDDVTEESLQVPQGNN